MSLLALLRTLTAAFSVVSQQLRGGTSNPTPAVTQSLSGPPRALRLMCLGLVFASACTQGGSLQATVEGFFHRLSAREFAAALELLRDADGNPVSEPRRGHYLRSWEDAYGAYDVEFTAIRIVGSTPIDSDKIARAKGVRGEDIRLTLEGRSNSPCVLLPPGQPTNLYVSGLQLIQMSDGRWFILSDSAQLTLSTCPGL